MKKLDQTAEEAMDTLDIADEDKVRYRKMLAYKFVSVCYERCKLFIRKTQMKSAKVKKEGVMYCLAV